MKEIASLLDDTIEKGMRLIKRSKIEAIEEDLVKGFSHDVMNPVTVTQFSQYHNPYQWADDGFIPLSADALQSKNASDPTAYLQNQIFYDKYVNYRKSLSSLEKSLDRGDLAKAGAVPVGSIHKFKDGQMYKKEETGWEHHTDQPSLAHAINSDDPNSKAEANSIIEDHAKKTISHTRESSRRLNKKNDMAKFKQEIMQEIEAMFDKRLNDSDDSEVEGDDDEGV